MKLPNISTSILLGSDEPISIQGQSFCKVISSFICKGEKLKCGGVSDSSEIGISTGPLNLLSIDEGLSALAGIIEPFEVEIVAFIQEHNCTVSFLSYVQVDEESLLPEISSESMRMMMLYNGAWSMDYYDYRSYDDNGLLITADDTCP